MSGQYFQTTLQEESPDVALVLQRLRKPRHLRLDLIPRIEDIFQRALEIRASAITARMRLAKGKSPTRGETNPGYRYEHPQPIGTKIVEVNPLEGCSEDSIHNCSSWILVPPNNPTMLSSSSVT